jgi:hypothetical protein
MRMRWAGHVGRMGNENVYSIFVRKPEGELRLGRPNVKVYLKDVSFESADCIHLTHVSVASSRGLL